MKTVGSGQWSVGSETPALPGGSRGTASSWPGPFSAVAPVRTDSGVILIALLWILTALSVIALSFARESFVEVAAARNAQSLESSYFSARAGIAATIYQIFQKRLMTTVQQSNQAPDPIDLGVVSGTFGNAEYRVDIQDESGKININTISEQQLRALVEASGIAKPDSDIIVDSILDWRDIDTQMRTNGAEDDYYKTLIPPYEAKDGSLKTVEELLLVRGMTADYFYGHPELAQDGSVTYRYGLSRYLTVYSTRSQININFAALPVLMSIPDMPLQAAKWIYDRRRAKPFKDIVEVTNDTPYPLGGGVLPYLSTIQAGVYTLTASAHAVNSKARRIVRTVISLTPGQSLQYQTLYWNENIPDYEGNTP